MLETAHGFKYDGLARCESTWCCPYCTPYASRDYAYRISHTLDACLAGGIRLYFVTLTARHHRSDALADTLTRFQAARRGLYASRGWRNLSKSFDGIGNLRVWEITDGVQHGWHAHTHEFWGFRTQSAPVHDFYPKAWANACKAVGLYSSRSYGTQVSDVSASTSMQAAYYSCSWGPGSELSADPYKHAKGGNRTCWDNLTAAQMGNEEGARRWQEFCEATAGRKRLSTSGKMRQYLVDKPEPIITDGTEIEGLYFSEYAWRVAVRRGLDLQLLDAIHAGNFAKCMHIQDVCHAPWKYPNV